MDQIIKHNKKEGKYHEFIQTFSRYHKLKNNGKPADLTALPL